MVAPGRFGAEALIDGPQHRTVAGHFQPRYLGTKIATACATLLTGLDEAGPAAVETFLEPEKYAQMIEAWRQATARAMSLGSARER
jgi:hypothetical protein